MREDVSHSNVCVYSSVPQCILSRVHFSLKHSVTWELYWVVFHIRLSFFFVREKEKEKEGGGRKWEWEEKEERNGEREMKKRT